MNEKGKITGFKPDYIRGGATLQLTVESADMGEIEGLSRLDNVRVEIKEWREPRSMTANKYFHTLSDKLADSRRMSKSEMKNYLLYEYGQKWRDENGNLICIKTNAPRETLMQSKDFHVWDAKASPDGTPMYVLLRHSSSFDSREMSILIDGVVAECKEAGIEVLSPQKLKELNERWKIENG